MKIEGQLKNNVKRVLALSILFDLLKAPKIAAVF